MQNFRLRVFRCVAQLLNFRKAAEELNMTQPAVSLQIKALEEELDLQLFNRAGGRIALTPAGATLLSYVERVDLLLAEAEDALCLFRGELRGVISVGASLTVAQYILPLLLGQFLREHPGVHMSVLSRNTEQIVESVAARHSSLGFIEGPARRRDVRVEPILQDEMVLIVPSGHPWDQSQPIALHDLCSVPLLTRERGSGSRHVVELALAKAGLPVRNLRVLVELDTTEAIKAAVESGLGVGFVSSWSIRKELRLGTLRTVKVVDLQIPRDISVVLPVGPEPQGILGHFLRLIREASVGLRSNLRT